MKNNLLFCLILFFYSSAMAQDQLNISVESGKFLRESTLVSMNISSFLTEKEDIQLYELINGKKTKVACQIELTEDSSVVYWRLEGKTNPGTERMYVAEKIQKNQVLSSNKMKIKNDGGGICIMSGEKPLLNYIYKTVYPPEGVDSVFRRSGFIHPLWSPSGNILTNIQPKDHYHHYGIWNPWTRIEYDGDIYDLWNLRDKQGTVKFARLIDTFEGELLSGFVSMHEHYIFNNQGEKEILKENWKVKATELKNQHQSSYLWDFESVLIPDTELPLILKEYRYAGFAFRATDVWTKDNSTMLTSEGKERQEIDGTRARWIYITGECKIGKSGILFMGHPQNYNYPEPLRIWDEQANGGRGDVFINFAPTKNMDWTLSPGNKYTLKYRMYVYDGEITPEYAEQLWTDFAFPPEVKLVSKK